MARTPRDRLARKREKVRAMHDAGAISTELRDALLEWSDALDPQTTRHKLFDEDGSQRTYEPRTIEGYLNCLRLSVERGLDLLDCTAEEVNDFMDGLHDDRGLSKVTLARYQSAARTFFRYHDHLGADPGDIVVYAAQSKPRHDERDMFTAAEVDALREACKYPRDRAFLELLIYTGQRITALRTLRVGDVDLDERALFLNDEADGLKGATERGRKRPLFGAWKFVRDWLDYHPRSDEPDAWLFTGLPDHWKTDLDEPWSEAGVRQQLQRIADRAGVDKPVNPHNFRHYFVTVMKRDYDLDNDTLRMLLGVREHSDILNTTYSHVTDEDYVRKAEQALGYADEERSESPLTPESCPTCGELLEDHWRRCPTCQEVFAPELKDLETEAQSTRNELLDRGIGDDGISAEDVEGFRRIVDAFDDPAALADELERRR